MFQKYILWLSSRLAARVAIPVFWHTVCSRRTRSCLSTAEWCSISAGIISTKSRGSARRTSGCHGANLYLLTPHTCQRQRQKRPPSQDCDVAEHKTTYFSLNSMLNIKNGTYKLGNERREGNIPCAVILSSFALFSSVPLPFPGHFCFLQILRRFLAGGTAVLKTNQLVVKVLAVNSSAVG